MEEEEEKDNVYKISVPIITNEELESLDYTLENDLDNIVQQITETVSKDRDIIILQKVIEKQQKEVEELDKKFQFAVPVDVINDLYISKDKIKGKMKELEEMPENQYIHLQYVKKMLRELLQSGQESDQEGG